MRKYKLLLAILFIIFGVSLGHSNSFAQISSTSATGISRPVSAEQILTNKTILEIDRRIASLNKLTTRIQAMKKLSDTNKNTLLSQVQDQITTLNTLKAKIQGDNDPTTLKNDRLAVANQYRIYLLFIPKMNILATSDRIMEITGDMDNLTTKLQTRINSVKQTGKDVTIMQTALDNIKSKIADANTQAKAAADLVTPLVPDNGDQTIFASNKQALQDARKKLVVARQDINSALQNFELIRQQLNPARVQVSSPSATK